MKTHLTELLAQAAKAIAPDLQDVSILIERPKTAQHGDFATNLAMTLARSLKQNPRAIAEALIKALPASPYLAKTEIAGAGFINFFMASGAKAAVVSQILVNPGFGKSQTGQRQKVQVEYVSANPTGPLHVGHGRGAAVGDCLCRLLDATGWDVTREFYYNDAGAQIDNLTLSVQCRCKGLTPDDPSWPENGYRGDYIIDVANAYMAKESIDSSDQRAAGKGDADNADAIRHFAVAYLRREQDLDLRAFKVTFDVFSLESALYTEGKVEQTVQQLIASGHTYEQDDALWLRTTDFGDDKDRVMKKRDGGYTYFVPDVAYHKDKWQRGFTRVINEQGADHHSTITRVRAGLQALDIGIPQGWPDYVLHQMVTVMRGGEEVKLSKRAGSYLTLRDLIDEAGRDATRWFLVARKPDSQLTFDIDLARSQSLDNPVYYVQLAHARSCGVFRQLAERGLSFDADNGRNQPLDLDDRATATLLAALSRWPEVVAAAGAQLEPHLVAAYLLELAQDFQSYYNEHQFLVEDANLRDARLALAAAARQVLANGLGLLGVNAPEAM